MEYRQLGRAGVRVSVLGLGTNRFGSDRLPQGEVNKMLDAALDMGINFDAAYYDMLEALTVWAAARGRGMNELAQAWLMAQPPVCSVITGATSLEQMLQNVTVASWTLTQAELGEVNAILEQQGTRTGR